MSNLRFSFMNHWKTIPYKHIENWRAFYYEDKSDAAYFSDWNKIAKYFSALGYEGIELAPWDMPDYMAAFGTPQNMVDFLKERGICVSGMFHGVHGGHERANFEQVLAEGKAAVDMLASFGGVHLNTCPASNYYGVGPLSREQLHASARVINAIGEYAEDHGIHVNLHNEFFCAINRENHREFIDMTDPRYVHYCLDTAQIAIIGEDMVNFYDDYHERIITFHLKDTADPGLADEVRYSKDIEIVDDGHRWFWEPGEGVLDFPALWRLMKKYGFQGWVSIETDGAPDILASMALTKWYIDHELAPIYR